MFTFFIAHLGGADANLPLAAEIRCLRRMRAGTAAMRLLAAVRVRYSRRCGSIWRRRQHRLPRVSIGRLEVLISLRVRYQLNQLNLSTRTIIGQIHFLPKALFPGLAHIKGLPPGIIEYVQATSLQKLIANSLMHL